MKIVVTGGTGFLGTNLCKYLLSLNHEVFCLDNNYTGSIKNIIDLSNNSNFHYIYHDIINEINDNIEEKIGDKIDQIYHLACPASPPKYQKNPIFTLKTCFIGTLNILEFAKKNNAKILLSSTSEIYGEPLETPQKEDYRGNVNTIGIRSCYDEGKRIAETLFMDYNRYHNLETRIIRIFNTYGPHMDINDGRVITNFINQATNNENITIYGDGLQTRSFCYVDDLINGMVKCMESNYKYPINLGNPNEMTVIDLANLIINLTNSSSKITYKELPKDDPTNRNPDITRANNILNWYPQIDIKIGLLKTIKKFS